MIDREPLIRGARSGRGTRSRLSVASPAGPGPRGPSEGLPSAAKPTHHRRLEAGIWEMSAKDGSAARAGGHMAKASVTETRRVRYEDDLYAWSQEQIVLLAGR
jgi:hypothetical protein